MQVLRDIYQVAGDLNGITFDVQGAMWNDGNAYVIDTSQVPCHHAKPELFL
jgi:metallo-beta-lactamase class B